MAPKKARSSSRSAPRPSTGDAVAAKEQERVMPPPDPRAVQKLIDEAIARAQANRGQPARNNSRLSRWCPLRLFSAFERVYSPKATAALTDLIGVFLVTVLTIYFTIAGYLFYREAAIKGL